MLKNVTNVGCSVCHRVILDLAFAGIEEAKKWVDKEFQPSTLSKRTR